MIWKTSSTYSRLLASDAGEIKTLEGKKLTQRTNSNGFRTVYFEGKKLLVHRIVCDAFHGPPEPSKVVCLHRGERGDNSPENVYWATHQERSNRRGRGVVRLSDGRSWRSARKAGEELGIDVPLISAAARIGEEWTYVG